MPVENKYQKDMIWIVWDIILSEAKNKNVNLFKIIKSILNLFCLKYKESFKNKRKLLIYYAISLLTETYDTTVPIVKDTNLIEHLTPNFNNWKKL